MDRKFSLKFAVALLVMLGTVGAVGEIAKIPAGTSRRDANHRQAQQRDGERRPGIPRSPRRPDHGKRPDVSQRRQRYRRSSEHREIGTPHTPGELHLTLRTIRTGGRTYAVAVRTIVIKGESHTKSNVTKIGGGTAMGALIGAIAGGGKGAAIGAGVGAAAGTGVAAGTGKKPAVVEPEMVLAGSGRRALLLLLCRRRAIPAI